MRPAVWAGIDVPAYKKDLSSLVGGTSASLTQLPTAALPTGYLVTFEVTGSGLSSYRLESSSAATASPGIIRPADYNGATNARAWVQVL